MSSVLLIIVALMLFYVLYFRKYETRYDHYKSIQLGQSLPSVLNIMGTPDTTYVIPSPNGKSNLLVYQYNMNFISPDDIRVIFLNEKVCGTTLNN